MRNDSSEGLCSQGGEKLVGCSNIERQIVVVGMLVVLLERLG